MTEGRILAQQAGAVTTVTFNRPEKLNAFDPAMMSRFRQAVHDAVLDPDTRVIVLAGSGRAFSSGFDRKALAATDDRRQKTVGAGLGGHGGLGDAVGDFVNNRERASEWLHLWDCPKPLIAQVQGYCLGVANEIVGCCDIVYCSETARFGMPEVREGIGLPPTLGFWPLRLGTGRIKELLFTGRIVDGGEAFRIGLADFIAGSDDELRVQVADLAARIAETPADRLSIIKHAANRWAEVAGMREAVGRGAEFHALFHQTQSVSERPTS